MRKENTIKRKLQQVKFRYLKNFISDYFAQSPETCAHNMKMPPSPVGNAPSVCGFGLGVGWEPSYCDRMIDDGKRARTCTLYCRFEIKTKENLKEEFNETLRNSTLPEIAAEYPDMAALLWVLGAPEALIEEDEVIPDEPVVQSDSSEHVDQIPPAISPPVVVDSEQEDTGLNRPSWFKAWFR